MSKHIVELLIKERLKLLNDLEDRGKRLMELRIEKKNIEFNINFDEKIEKEIKVKINDMNELLNKYDKNLVTEIDDEIRNKMRGKKWEMI